MSPKDKVKANIYKELLLQEKQKHKKYVKASLSVFLVGIISVSSYHNHIKSGATRESSIMLIRNGKIVEAERNNKIDLDHLYSRELFEKKNRDLDPDNFFGLLGVE